MDRPIPVVLFCYSRPEHLGRVLACLRENGVPLIHAYADGAKEPGVAARVSQVRALLRGVDWCDLRLVERTENLGLGHNVIDGVTEVAAQYESFVVWEDDLICAPGTYAWMCAALRHYANDPRVMSVTGWTHPRVAPSGLRSAPYFDGRAEGWVWGAYARTWRGMDDGNAEEKMRRAAARGVSPEAYGHDLVWMARDELTRNIWAVRWYYHHLEHGGLCLRPSRSLVEHIGFDTSATNSSGDDEWAQPNPLTKAPELPVQWPEVVENPDCQRLWRRAFPGVWGRRLRGLMRRLLLRRTPLSS